MKIKLFLVILLAYSWVYASNGCSVLDGHYTSSATTKLDLLLDIQITMDDTRMKSIIYSASANPKNIILIRYLNPNALPLANKLARDFASLNLQVTKPQLLNADDIDDSHYVLVNICYVETLDKLVD